MPPGTFDLLLPFYGDPALMRIAVQSVMSQSDPDWRLVVVDDGYPDPSIPGWFADLGDDRIEYHRNDHNLGANRNYQRALSLAQAEYVAFLGADDILLPAYVARARSILSRFGHEVAMYQPGVNVIDESGMSARSAADHMKRILRPRVRQPDVLHGEMLAASLLRGNWTYFPSICWRREALQAVGFRAGLDVVQDLAMILDLVALGHSLILDPAVTFAYRRHSSSDSSVRALNGQRFTEEHAFFVQAAQEMQSLGWLRARRAARRHTTSRLNAVSLVPTALRNRDPRAVLRLVRHAGNVKT